MWESTSGLPADGTRPTANIYTTANRMNNATYDAAGNQTTVPNLPGASQAYDAENRIVTVTGSGTTTYAYDGDGHRVQKTASAGTTNYVYDAFGNLVAEYNSAAAPAAPCLTCYLSTDHLGSVRMITDQAGNVVSRHDYTPFGEEIPAGTGARTTLWGATDNVSQKFTGKERDPESGLDYFGARYHGSALGRFTSPDEFTGGPVDVNSPGEIEAPGPRPYANIRNPQSLNKYAYALNNPLKYVDPDGHDPVMDEVEEELPALTEACGAGAGPCAQGVGNALEDLGTTYVDNVKDFANGLKIVGTAVVAYFTEQKGSDPNHQVKPDPNKQQANNNGQNANQQQQATPDAQNSSEHMKVARPSTQEQHQAGQSRKKRAAAEKRVISAGDRRANVPMDGKARGRQKDQSGN